ncbi:MAG: methyltransferase domain-containing protein [Acidobacteriaceae bacterium]|nr:methyltransferase domain-containing protein [Acidobacteriaceae bacterium]
MIRVAILGSCVTADAFAYEFPPLEEVFYHGHTSLVSLNSPAIPVPPHALDWASAYVRAHLVAELHRTVVPLLAETRPDVIVFDFMGERFDLLRCEGLYVTASDELSQQRALEDLGYGFERVRTPSTEVSELWKSSAVAVARQIRDLLPKACFVLHRAFWAEEYVDETAIKPFWSTAQREAGQMNKTLSCYYTWFEQNVPGVHSVEVQPGCRAFAQHRRGLQPFHYEPPYYEELLHRILETVTGKSRHTETHGKAAGMRPWDDTFLSWIERGRAKGIDPNEVGDQEWDDIRSHIERVYMPHIRPDSMVLELGPGSGRVTRYVIGRCREMILVDYSEMACRWLDEYLQGKGRFRTYCVDSPAMPEVADASVDFAFAFGVMEHINLDAMRAYLEEFHRVLVVGGRAVFNFDNIMTREGLAWHDKFRRMTSNPTAFQFYHPETVAWISKAAGFTVTALRAGESRFGEIELLKERPSPQ